LKPAFEMLFHIFLWLCEEWGAFKRVISLMPLQKYHFFKKVPSVRGTISVLKLISIGKNYYIWVCVCMCTLSFFVTAVWYTFIDGDALDKYYKLRTLE
jgi:hypothetical protein